TNDTTNWLLGRLTGASVTSLISQSGGSPPLSPTPTFVTISSSTKNFHLWKYLSSITAGAPASVNLTIAGGVVISFTSPSTPAFDTGVFPSGSTVQITNNGTIIGGGGNGGNGGMDPAVWWCPGPPATSGGPGGPAMRAQIALTLANNGSIWGGGGGGGGG